MNSILSRLWFWLSTRRACCYWGVHMGNNPFGWRTSHGVCPHCFVDQTEIVRGTKQLEVQWN